MVLLRTMLSNSVLLIIPCASNGIVTLLANNNDILTSLTDQLMDGRGSPTTVQFNTASLPLITMVSSGGTVISGATTIKTTLKKAQMHRI